MKCPIHCEVVGLDHVDRTSLIKALMLGDELLLIRMPENEFDKNAIRVETIAHDHLGYINREMAARLAPLFDQFTAPISAYITSIEGGDYSLRKSINIGLTQNPILIARYGGQSLSKHQIWCVNAPFA